MGIYVFKKDVLVKLLNEVGGGAQGCVCGGGLCMKCLLL